MKTNIIFKMAALLLGMTMTCVTMTSCSNDDNPVDLPGDEPSVGGATVKELSELTTAEIGWVIAADGKAYMNSAAATAAGTEALAMLGYFNEGLDGSIWGRAIQITDCPLEVSWEDAKAYIKTLPKFEGASWFMPEVGDWEYLFRGCAIKGDATERLNNNIMKPINGFRDKMLAACPGWQNYWYWTSTEEGSSNAWIVGPAIKYTEGHDASALFNNESKSYEYAVRGFLYFWVK